MKYTQLNLTINGCTRPHNLFVTRLGKQKIILGYPWFKQNNPEIDWEKCTLTLWKEQDNCEPTPKPLVEEETDQENWKNHTINLIEELDNEEIGNAVLISYIEEMKTKVWINAKGNMATELAIKENEKKAKLANEELVPEDLHEFLDVFDGNKANWFPESNVWDHKIDMKEGFESKSFKNYNLTLEEQKELDKFLDKNLEKKIHSTISISYGFSLLLCQKERWKIMTLPRLSVLEWLDHQKHLSPTIDLWNNGQVKRGKVFFKIQCTMGI